MITIEYTKHASPVSDFELGQWLRDFINIVKSEPSKVDTTFCVSTEGPILMVRLAILQGKIDHKLIRFKFKNTVMSPNEYGVVVEGYPKGYCDLNGKLYYKLLKFGVRKGRKDREIEKRNHFAERYSRKGSLNDIPSL